MRAYIYSVCRRIKDDSFQLHIREGLTNLLLVAMSANLEFFPQRLRTYDKEIVFFREGGAVFMMNLSSFSALLRTPFLLTFADIGLTPTPLRICPQTAFLMRL